MESIVCNGLTKTYRSRTMKTALNDLDLVVRKGEILGLLGPNGAGKTTLVKILTTILKPETGTASVGGYDVVREGHKVREIIGYAGQDSERSGIYRLTVEENLIFFACALRNVAEPVAKDRIADLARFLSYSDKLSKQFSTLSGGEKQVFVNMRSLIHDPEICFLDEPTRSLDPIAARRMRDCIRAYRQAKGATFFLTTHNLREAEELCDRIALVRNGRLRFLGTPGEFKELAGPSEIVELRPAAVPQKTLSDIAALPGVLEITSGDSWHRIRCESALRVLPDVAKLIEAAEVRVSVAMTEPSVEDAFEIEVKSDQ